MAPRDSGERLSVNSLRDQALKTLRGWIVSGDLLPGELYTIRGIADRLGVSTTPVREAVHDMASSDIVEIVRNRGFRVCAVDEKVLDELMYIRLQLEVGTLELVAGRLSAERAASYEELLDRMDELAGSPKDEHIAAYLDVSREFHLGLIDELGMPRVTALIAQMRDQARMYRLNNDQILGSANEEHRALLKAIVNGDSNAVRVIATQHVLNTRSLWAGHDLPTGLVREIADTLIQTRTTDSSRP